MALEAQNNPFPSVLMVEAADETDPTPDALPATGQRRLIVGPDHLLYLLDDAGVATLVGGGATVDDATISTSDITTNNASTSKHGWLKKLSNVSTEYMSGTGVWSTPAGATSGALILLEQHTASSSATLDFTTFISSTYDEYIFEMLDLVPATTNVAFVLRVGTGGGPTYDTAGNYGWAAFRWSNSGSAVAGAGIGGDSSVHIDGNGGVINTSTVGLGGHIRLFSPQGAKTKLFIGNSVYVDNAGSPLSCSFSGFYNQTTTLT